MKDRFIYVEEQYMRLKKDYDNYGCLVIAFDFDDTVYDYHKRGDTFERAIETLQWAQELGMQLMCFSRVYEWDDIVFKSKYIEQVLGLKLNEGGSSGNTRINRVPDYYPDNAPRCFANHEGNRVAPIAEHYNKPFYNILLDDKAGLGEAINVLERVLHYISREIKEKE